MKNKLIAIATLAFTFSAQAIELKGPNENRTTEAPATEKMALMKLKKVICDQSADSFVFHDALLTAQSDLSKVRRNFLFQADLEPNEEVKVSFKDKASKIESNIAVLEEYWSMGFNDGKQKEATRKLCQELKVL